jgi:hypothetical protein
MHHQPSQEDTAMTEPVAPETAPAAPEAPQQQPENQSPDSLPAWARESLTKANREAAQYRSQVNELKPLADQFRALEESTKSEAQRLAEAAEAAKRDAENYRAEAVRYKAAATHGIPADHFDLLGSGTEEEITARAAKLSALLAAQTQPPAPVPQRRPVEQMRPGATPGDAESEDDVLYAQLFGK